MVRNSPHYLSPLATTKVPKRLAFMNVETQTVGKTWGIEHTWECGAMGLTHWTAKRGERKDELKVFEAAADMWAMLDRFCLPSKRVTVFTFDLPVQLRTSGALVHLPKLGWHLETVVLEPGAAWAMFKDDKRSLMFCDLKSWTPYDWERLQRATVGRKGLSRIPLVGGNPTRELSYNKAAVIREAVLQILAWIEHDDLGPFRPTGSGQSYSAFRRAYLHDRILVHADTARLMVERSAMWSGRTEAWRHGHIAGGPFIELDMRAAYTRIASRCNVPTVALGRLHKPPVKRLLAQTGKFAFLCRVEIDTEVPIAPAAFGGHTLWPVGKFVTWVWDPELWLLDKYATSVKVHEAYRYHVAPALRDFSRYVLDTLDAPDVDHLGVPALVMKHWSRTLVGRLGLRYRSWVPYSSDNDPDLSMVTFIDADRNIMTDMLCVGRDMLILGSLEESTESVPQIPGWVMSECRRRLWETMVDIGLDRVVYIDTDSIIFDTKGETRYGRAVLKRHAGLWAPKARHVRMRIHGPRNLTVDDSRRVSGLPLAAAQTGDRDFTGEVMRSVRESMRFGHLDTVATVPRNFTLSAVDIRRGHNPDGTTYAFRINPQSDVLED